MDAEQIKEEALRALSQIGTDVRKDIWTEQHSRFLEQMARDVAGLTLKLQGEKDPEKQARYRRAIALIGNHVAVMAFSRLNVVERNAEETVLTLLQKVARLVLDALLARLGL